MPGPAIQPAKANREPEESYKTLESPAVKRSADKNANDVHEEKPGLEEERREGASELKLSFLPIVLLNHIQICDGRLTRLSSSARPFLAALPTVSSADQERSCNNADRSPRVHHALCAAGMGFY